MCVKIENIHVRYCEIICHAYDRILSCGKCRIFSIEYNSIGHMLCFETSHSCLRSVLDEMYTQLEEIIYTS